jgi:hypothetical protein
MEDLLNFKSPFYDFYSVQAPVSEGLPGGGGYVIQGIATAKQRFVTTNTTTGVNTVTYLAAPGSVGVTAVSIAPDGANKDYWSGVDTNFVLRAKGGLRISGGTSTGRRNVNTCALLVDDPPVGQRLNEGRERDCDRVRPFQTNVRGTASYTIPWIDVLASSTFSYRPGSQINATYTVGLADLGFAPDAVILETAPPVAGSVSVPAGSPRVVAVQNTLNQQTSVALLSNDTFGEGIRLVDLRLAKNIRFSGKRINIGVDVFNLFNSDAALGYCGTFPNPSQNIQGCGNAAAGTLVPWGAVNNITTPRYARFQVQFDF